MNITQQKCGYIAIVGRPNVGKSTLLNTILEKKISITSSKPQTTRFQILGIKTIENCQAIYIDTPGIHPANNRAMNRYLNRLATSVLLDANVIVMMVDANYWHKDDELVLNQLENSKIPIILAVNKVDEIKDKRALLPFINQLKDKFEFAAILPISAKKLDNVAELQQLIMNYLPESPHYFSDEMITDKNEKFHMAEIIREKIIKTTGQEVPYSVAVEIELFKPTTKRAEISAIIWVEREGQKPIIIGKKGERLKNIGIYARKDIEQLLNKSVNLKLWVKVKDNWTDDERALSTLGYL